MKNVHKAMGLLAVLCALAALFACTRENSAPSPTPEPVTIRQQATGETESLADMVARLSPSVVGIATRQNGQQGIGSGVIVSADGYILTNHHVAAEGAEVTLIFADGTKELASAVWSSQALDLAIVKAKGGSYPAAAMGSVEDVRVGEQVVAIGTPLALQFQHTVTGGIVSALNRTLQVPSGRSTAFMEQLIQTDVAINPGNSGGAAAQPARGGDRHRHRARGGGRGHRLCHPPSTSPGPIVEHFLADGRTSRPRWAPTSSTARSPAITTPTAP